MVVGRRLDGRKPPPVGVLFLATVLTYLDRQTPYPGRRLDGRKPPPGWARKTI
jgi:hypothetical protein